MGNTGGEKQPENAERFVRDLLHGGTGNEEGNREYRANQDSRGRQERKSKLEIVGKIDRGKTQNFSARDQMVRHVILLFGVFLPCPLSLSFVVVFLHSSPFVLGSLSHPLCFLSSLPYLFCGCVFLHSSSASPILSVSSRPSFFVCPSPL